MSERAAVQYCPYCGESDLWPVEEPSYGWRCAGCTRVFTVKFAGLGSRSATAPARPEVAR